MTKYRVNLENGFVEFGTSQEAIDYISLNQLNTTHEEITESLELSPLLTLEQKSAEYINFGVSLYEKIKQKVWALNTYNKSIGLNLTTQEMLSLLSTSDTLEKSMKTGSFDTAIYIANQFKTALPQYTDIANFAIDEMNYFLGRA